MYYFIIFSSAVPSPIPEHATHPVLIITNCPYILISLLFRTGTLKVAYYKTTSTRLLFISFFQANVLQLLAEVTTVIYCRLTNNLAETGIWTKTLFFFFLKKYITLCSKQTNSNGVCSKQFVYH